MLRARPASSWLTVECERRESYRPDPLPRPPTQRHRRTSATQASVRRGRFTSVGGPSRASTTGRALVLGERHTRWGVRPVGRTRCRSPRVQEWHMCGYSLSATGTPLRGGPVCRSDSGQKSPSARVAQVRAIGCVQAWLKSRRHLMTAIRHRQCVPQSEVSKLWLGAPPRGEGYL